MEPFLVGYAGVVLFVAYLVRGMTGFGSGLIAVPLLALSFPLTVVVPLVAFLDYVGSASHSFAHRRHIAWREQLVLIPFMLIGIGAGVVLLQSMSASVLTKVLGGFVLTFAIYQLLPLPPLPAWSGFAAPCGILGGLVGMLFSTGGPFYVIYLTLRRLEKTVFRATFAINFLIDGGIRLTAYAGTGLVDRNLLLGVVAALPMVAAGLFVGGRIHAGFSQATFERVISAVLLLSGTALLVRG